MASAEQAVRTLEAEWSDKIYAGFSPSASPAAILALKQFLQDHLADTYVNIDHEGTPYNKQDEIDGVGSGLYIVTGLTRPPGMRTYPYNSGTCVVVVGTDEVAATYNGHDVGGEFIWTDTWVNVDNEWRCVAHHGSKLAPHFVIPKRPRGQKSRGTGLVEGLPAPKK